LNQLGGVIHPPLDRIGMGGRTCRNRNPAAECLLPYGLGGLGFVERRRNVLLVSNGMNA